jgi:ketosteroid isomerase-like protein
MGEFRGIAGLQRVLEIASEHIAHDEALDFSDIRVGGNLVVMQFVDAGRILSTGKRYRSWCQYVFEYERGRVVRAENTCDTAAVLDAFLPDQRGP